jgi:hypothetical protein
VEYISGIEIIVMTRDRPEYLERAVKAINNIDFGLGAHFIISNNSEISLPITVPETGNWSVRNREESLTFQEHFEKVLEEVTHEWVCITHDDDELLPHFGKLFRQFSNNKNIRFISGLTEISNREFDPTANIGYQNRILKSGLTKRLEYECSEFLNLELRHGSLLPFSAIAIRSSYIEKINYDKFMRFQLK